jgi:hypothetical protein
MNGRAGGDRATLRAGNDAGRSEEAGLVKGRRPAYLNFDGARGGVRPGVGAADASWGLADRRSITHEPTQ